MFDCIHSLRGRCHRQEGQRDVRYSGWKTRPRMGNRDWNVQLQVSAPPGGSATGDRGGSKFQPRHLFLLRWAFTDWSAPVDGILPCLVGAAKVAGGSLRIPRSTGRTFARRGKISGRGRPPVWSKILFSFLLYSRRINSRTVLRKGIQVTASLDLPKSGTTIPVSVPRSEVGQFAVRIGRPRRERRQFRLGHKGTIAKSVQTREAEA